MSSVLRSRRRTTKAITALTRSAKRISWIMLKSQLRICSTSGAEAAVISGNFDIHRIGRFDRAFQITSNAFFQGAYTNYSAETFVTFEAPSEAGVSPRPAAQ